MGTTAGGRAVGGPAVERPAWRVLADGATAQGLDPTDVRRIGEQASGWAGAEWYAHQDDPATMLGVETFTAMVARRLGGEPLQYVLGGWGFRTLDLLVDRRVLIPRPETEQVVEAALAVLDELDELGGMRAADLGTGSGAIALALAAERPDVAVWATDVSPGALDVARANLAGAGRAGARVRLAQGSWYEALPGELRGRLDLVVANPPYVASTDALPPEVADWEPAAALVAGPTGLEAIERIVAGAPRWLRRPGALVLEIGETQGDAVLARAGAASFTGAEIRPDLAGRPRILVARLPGPAPVRALVGDPAATEG